MRYSFCLLLALFFLLRVNAHAQTAGCTDAKANNYNAAAVLNDGSCTYPVTNYTPALQANLPDKLREISGLAFVGNRWWAHEDSGASAIFYQINPQNGQVLQEIELKNGKNSDWEDIASDAQNLYIGDFGNNLNDRKNLGVYRVPIAKIGNTSSEKVSDNDWKFVGFAYPDQSNFSTQPEDSTEFDCEAMIFKNGFLHLFTKNRKTYQTSHYRLNPQTGAIKKLETFDCQGLITGASVSPDGKLVTLIGYDLRGLPTVFAWLLWDWPNPAGDSLFTGNKRRIELGSALFTGQAESIAFSGPRAGYIANERTEKSGIVFVEQGLRRIDFATWVPQSSATAQADDASWQISPNPFSQFVDIQLGNSKTSLTCVRLFDTTGRLAFEDRTGQTRLFTGHLPLGLYVMELLAENQIKRMLVQKM